MKSLYSKKQNKVELTQNIQLCPDPKLPEHKPEVDKDKSFAKTEVRKKQVKEQNVKRIKRSEILLTPTNVKSKRRSRKEVRI